MTGYGHGTDPLLQKKGVMHTNPKPPSTRQIYRASPVHKTNTLSLLIHIVKRAQHTMHKRPLT